MTEHEDRRWMEYALRLGRRHLGLTWPNPSVGCVVVKNNRLVGMGVTAPGGRPHAEPQALAMAGRDAVGATAYVTLEPCAHYGQTPPCAETLRDAGIARVVVALEDPDPRVNGGGRAILEAAGISVSMGMCRGEAERDQVGYLKRLRNGRPFVTLKLAQSLDGRVALASGESKWITGAEARRTGHGFRANHDAILVGHGTLTADQPQLTSRLPGLQTRSPIRVIASSDGACNIDTMVEDAGPPIWIMQTAPKDGFRDAGPVQRERVPATDDGRINLHAMMERLASLGITRLYCEGGPTLGTSLLKEDLVDQIVLFSAPMAIGGDGRPTIAELGLGALDQAPAFSFRSHRHVGDDVLSVLERA